MKKRLFLAALVLGLLITGCTKEESAAVTADEAGEVQTMEDFPQEEVPLSRESYGEIIDHYRQALAEQWDAEALDKAGLSPLCAELSPENVGYVMVDFDSDGTEELVIGVGDVSDHSQMVLLEMNTLADDTPVLVFCSEEDVCYYLCKALDDGSALLFEQQIFEEEELCEWKSLHWYEGNMKVDQALRKDQTGAWMMGYETEGAVEYHLPVSEELAADILEASEASRIVPEYEFF